MKIKLIIIVGIVLVVASIFGGYNVGWNLGKEYVTTHLGQYTNIVKPVSYDEVVVFLKEDQTDKAEYTDDFDCITFANEVKSNANKKGIKCAVVSMDVYDVKKLVYKGHTINLFDTTDKGLVYFDPQTDEPRYNVEVGNYYNLSEQYKITKVDIIW